MSSQFRIQIIDEQGNLAASWVPGSAVEQELTKTITEALVAKGVGIFRTEAHVRAACESAIREVLFNLKAQVRVS